MLFFTERVVKPILELDWTVVLFWKSSVIRVSLLRSWERLKTFPAASVFSIMASPLGCMLRTSRVEPWPGMVTERGGSLLLYED